MDPRWIALISDKDTGQDYLGLRLIQEHIVGHLMPGIITITPRARYYAFYSWVLVEYAQQHPPGWSLERFIHRREQIFGLANIAFGGQVPGLSGSQKFIAHWQNCQSEAEISLTLEDYLRASHGGYNAYAGVMRSLGLVLEDSEGEGWIISVKGEELAAAYVHSIAGTAYYQDRYHYDDAAAIPPTVLQEYGNCCCLDKLPGYADHLPTLELLLALDAPYAPDPASSNSSPVGNMRGTLGMILEMLSQNQMPLDDTVFRRHITHSGANDYLAYQPANELRPIFSQWKMFQLRELYTYALYALWTYFLHWLKLRERASWDEFCSHLNEVLVWNELADDLNVHLFTHGIGELSLQDHLTQLLDAVSIPERPWTERCQMLAQQSQSPLAIYNLYECLSSYKPNEAEKYLGTAWLLLASLYMHLTSLPRDAAARYWVEHGETQRKPLILFVEGMDTRFLEGTTVRETIQWLFRDYVIAQHILACLDKWRNRGANTFHFRYEDGWFEFVREGRTDLSASRFRQVYDMLNDLALFQVDGETNVPHLTDLGQQTLQKILESYHA